MDHKIAFIGAGNMARSLISGLIQGDFPNKNIWVSNPRVEKLEQLHKLTDVNVTQDNKEAVNNADIVVLTVKPNIIPLVLDEIKTTWQKTKPLIISVAAGFREDTIRHHLDERAAVIRTMPNTPSLLGSGATALYANENVSEEQKEIAESILRSVGVAIWIKHEKFMDAATALSGSGPAYFFLMMEALSAAAEELGLDKNQAQLLTAQTALGAARMALETDKSFTELKEAVTSKGGTTQAALESFTENNFKQIVTEAVDAAYQRSREIGDELATHSK